MKRVARTLKTKAISSFRRATAAFNGVEDDGRQTAVLLHLQHSFEMLLKGALCEKNVDVFERGTDSTVGRSIGYEKCVRLARQHVSLTEEQCGTLRAIDAMRDDEQHWIADFNEGLLYLHARAGVTLFDEILRSVFNERLADHLPERVLPISTTPPTDIEVLIGEQFTQVRELLRPGNRKRVEARAILRGLLALESHVSEDAAVNERDVNRVMKGVLDGGTLEQVFPRLANVGTAISGEGPSLTVHFTKRQGAPVHFIPADDPREAAAVREIDLQRKYYIPPRKLAERAGLTAPKGTALRRELGIDDDEDCVHEFVFESQRIKRYSDNALRKMKGGVETLDMDDVWKRNKPRRPAALLASW
jgi:hypothetical protein